MNPGCQGMMIACWRMPSNLSFNFIEEEAEEEKEEEELEAAEAEADGRLSKT